MDSCPASPPSSWGRDLLLMAFAAGAACAAIAAYNRRVDRLLAEEEGRARRAAGPGGGVPDRPAATTAAGGGAVAVAASSLATSLARGSGATASGNMLSAIVAQMWSHLSVAIASTVKETVEPILMETLPVKVHFTKLDLGKVPIKVRDFRATPEALFRLVVPRGTLLLCKCVLIMEL